MLLLTTFTLISFSQAVFADNEKYAKIYKKQCATCHGNQGDGKGRASASFATVPTDFTSAQSKRTLTAERIKKAIRDGVAGSSMVAYGRRFDEEMLDGLTDFIQTSFMSRATRQANNMTQRKDGNPGQVLYDENCSACHGDKGQSAVWAKNGLKPAPRNFTTVQAREELSRERMIASVTYGRPGTAMMSFSKRLSSAEIEAVVDYIRENFMKKPARNFLSTGHNQAVTVLSQSHEIKENRQAPFDGGIVGNALNGKVFYEANCFTCHGKNGDGKGPRADFNYPRPRDFTSENSRIIFNRPRLFQSISQGKRGSVMPAWNKVLSQQEIADVAEFVFQQFILNKNVLEVKKKP